MALFCGRIANKHILSSIRGLPSLLGTAQYAQAAQNAPKIVFKPYEPPKLEDHDQKNMKLNRPMSPHLTIYAPQLTSMTSITHRITGAILFGYAILLAFGALVLPNGVDSYIYMIQSMVLSGYFIVIGCGALVLPHDVSHYISMVEGLQLSSATLFAAKFVLAAPFGYHCANGMRHLLWDTGRALTLKEVYTTGYAMFAAAAVISVALAAL